jgi:fermentation-respiration switch protein FrsA (DUF1100 family)
MRNRFDSEKAIEAYDGPVHQSHGEIDRVIPFRFGKKLFEKTSHPLSKFVNLGQFGHNDGYPSRYWERLSEWLDAVETAHSAGADVGREWKPGLSQE